MKTLDKKQIPQFAALCVLSAGLFGYLIVKIVKPSTVAAGTLSVSAPIARPSTAKTANAPLNAANAAGANIAGANAAPDSTTPETDGLDAPPPSPGMRDPFAVGYVEPKMSSAPAAPVTPTVPSQGKQIASIKGIGPAPISFPSAPALPASLSGFPSQAGPSAPGLPTGPAVPTLPSPPSWTVTGVLQGPTEKIAVLRNGEARRIVRAGDLVDSTYRVVAVSRTSVVLRHGTASYQLPLGGPKDTAKKQSATGAASLPTTAPTATELTAAPPSTTDPSTAASAPTAPTVTQPESVPTSILGLADQILTHQSTTEAHH